MNIKTFCLIITIVLPGLSQANMLNEDGIQKKTHIDNRTFIILEEPFNGGGSYFSDIGTYLNEPPSVSDICKKNPNIKACQKKQSETKE